MAGSPFNALAASRHAEFVRKMLGEDIRHDSVTPELGIQIVNEQDRLEYSFLKSEIRFATQVFFVGAVGAQAAFVQLFNPFGSNRIVVVTDYWGSTNVAGRINQALTSTVRGVSGNTLPIILDTRYDSPIVPAAALTARDPCVVTVGNVAAFGTDVPIIQLTSTAFPTKLPFPPVVLAPGSGVVLSDNTLNESMSGMFGGYSRVVKPEELL